MKARCWLVAAVVPWLLVACAQEQALEACNIALHPCQEDVYYAVLRARGDGWDPFAGLPPIRTITLAQYREELLGSQPQPSPSEPAMEPAPDPWGSALQLLGLVTPTTTTMMASVDSQVDNVAAFYAPATRNVTVIDRGQARDDASDTVLLAHELVHALQDRELGGGLGELDTDEGFASRAFIEGEAVLYERLIAQELRQRDFTRSDWERYYDGWLNGLRMSMPQQRSPFFAAPWFVYPLGGGLLTRSWLDGGNAAVRRLSGAHPQHSVAYMQAATGAASAVAAADALRCSVPRAVGSFRRVGFDRFGAIQLYAFLTRAGLAEDVAWQHALHWRDDQLGVYFDPERKSTLVSWRVRFQDDTVAQSVAAGLASLRDPTRVAWSATVLNGPELQIWASEAPAAISEDDPALACP